MDVMGKDLTNQNFSGQDLRGKDFFRNANLRGANFSRANLQNVDFSNAELQGANFKGANLRGANFTNSFVDDDASLPEVNFSYANIQGVNFTDAELIGADFTGARAGLSRSWSFFVILCSIVLCLLSAFPTAIISTFSIYFFGFVRKNNPVLVSFFVGIHSVFITISIRSILLNLSPNRSLVNWHVGVGVMMMIMVLSGTIVATVMTDTQDDFVNVVIWFTIISLVVLICIGVHNSVHKNLPSIPPMSFFNSTNSQQDFGIFGAIIGAFFGCWFARTAISEKNRFKWLWKIYIQIVTRGGTAFKNANLTNVTFDSAELRGANFKNAKIEGTVWHRVKYLEYAHVGNCYLKYSKVQKLILGQKLRKDGDKIFNDLNLEGINLEEKNLRAANFTGANLNRANLRNANLTDAKLQRANLNQANLQDANLTNAKLQQAKLNGADLTSASLTGAYLEDWSIDEQTILSQVECKYIFQAKLPDNNEAYRRFPPSPRTFRDREFEKIFIKDKRTIQLFIRSDDNKEALMAAIEKLKQDTNSGFRGLERVGEDFLLKIEITEKLDASNVEQIENNFYLNYNTAKKNQKDKSGSKQDENLSMTNILEFLLKVLKVFLEKPNKVVTSYHIHNSEDVTCSTSHDQSRVNSKTTKIQENKNDKP
ncbi:MAG: pentapeptide repeat-containing protein [Symploca sp. SIO3E6]|nr:pentapeptide repeat-containing protein [Caldora sp. SIO3E6]